MVAARAQEDGSVLVNVFNTGDVPADRLIAWDLARPGGLQRLGGRRAKGSEQPAAGASRRTRPAPVAAVLLPAGPA